MVEYGQERKFGTEVPPPRYAVTPTLLVEFQN